MTKGRLKTEGMVFRDLLFQLGNETESGTMN